ncbi:MAG: DUF3857 domain-containing protein [Phycisphaerae bacterium]|nr:DUF3857 domain-containing protein [Phycisphaerae bacterium]
MNRWQVGWLLLIVLLTPLGARADDDVRARIDAAGDAERWDADTVVVFDHTDVTVRPNGIGTARHHRVVKVLRDGGIRCEAVQRFPFDPHTNRLELIAVRVYRGDGTVEELPIAGRVQQPQPAHGIYWGTQQYLVQVPRLAVGGAVETITEMTGFNVAYLADDGDGEVNALGEVLKPPVPGHWHDEVDFWSGVPVIEQRYTVRCPKDKPLQYEVYNGELRVAVLFEGDEIVYSFEKDDIEPLKTEPHMEPAANVAPKLLLATLPTWEDKSRWLHEVSEPSFEADDAIRAKVAEVIKDCQTDEEKYTALNHWVAENIRYAGTSRGMCEGYTNHDVVETFHDRCGVCKDKAGMLVGMLRVAGFDSFLVMTMARQRVDRVPADQFNHAVTCIRDRDTGDLILLDPTWMPKSRDNWSTLEPLQHVVFGIPEGHELSQSPYFTPEENMAAWQAQSTYTADGGVRGELQLESNGAPDGRLRRMLSMTLPEECRAAFDKTAQRLAPDARLTVTSYTDPLDFSRPVTIAGDYESDAFALGDGPRRYLKLPMMQTLFGDRVISDLFGDTDADERKYGLRLLATRMAKIDETVRLPEGWTVADLPEAVELDGPSAALEFSIEKTTPNTLHYTCEMRIKHWLIPPDEYSNFKEVIEQFEELTGYVVTCDLEGRND